ncbi:hypothetical protein OIV83_004026 [Microbotryomycetes sp. JL201]|nr:hypothetical protein OIV83_004026 [Microbotryomycetes sp. JL201]
MVQLQLTAPLQDRLASLQLPVELRELVARYVDAEPTGETPHQRQQQQQQKTIPHDVLVKVAQWSRDQQGRGRHCTLASLLKLTDIYAPPLPHREKSPELLAILAQIQQEQDQKAYDSMTSLSFSAFTSQIPTTDPYSRRAGQLANAGEVSIAEEWKQIRRQVGAIVNVLVSMVTVATGVWWVGGGRSVEARLALAMFGAVAIAAIEGFLYYRFFTQYSGDATKQRRKIDQQRRLQLGEKAASLATKKLQ